MRWVLARCGSPPDQLLRVAARRSARLMVLEVHGRSCDPSWTNALRVVASERCPVLTVRASFGPDKEADRRSAEAMDPTPLSN